MSNTFSSRFDDLLWPIGDDSLTKRERRARARHYRATAGAKSTPEQMDALAERMRSRIAPREETTAVDTIPMALPRQPRGETFNALWMKVAEIRTGLDAMGVNFSDMDDAVHFNHLLSQTEQLLKTYPYGREDRRLAWAQELLRLSALALSAYEHVAYRE